MMSPTLTDFSLFIYFSFPLTAFSLAPIALRIYNYFSPYEIAVLLLENPQISFVVTWETSDNNTRGWFAL